MNPRKIVNSSDKHARIIAILAVVFLVASMLGNQLIVETAPSAIPDVPYAYRMSIAQHGIDPVRLVLLDEQRVLVIGSMGDIHGVFVLRIGDPYSGTIVEDIYPLTGHLTSFATNGYPVTRIAVGSDKGEILLLRVDKGRITKHLYAVLGADFYVSKVMIAETPGGDFKIIALTSEKGQRTYPCLDCYIYVLDEDASGVLRIGPRVGNATSTCRGLEAIRIQDVAPLMIYGDRRYYHDASKVAISYIPQLVSLEFKISYLNETEQTVLPLPGTLVEVQLLYVDQGVSIIYGVNANENGLVQVPIPRLERTILQVNLIIRDSTGRTLYNYTYVYNPLAYRDIPDTIPLPSIILRTKEVDNRVASNVYGTPPFLQARVDLVDLSQAPSVCSKIGSADFSLEPSFINMAYLKGALDERSKLIYYDYARGFIYIVTTSEIGDKIGQLSLVRDYIGTNIEVIDAGTYIDGKYIVIGLADGRLRLYVKEGNTYRLKSIYTMGSTLNGLLTIPSTSGYTYVAMSSSGVQVLRVEPSQIPVFRGLMSLYLSTADYITGNVLGDLSTIILAEKDSLIVVKNTNMLIRDQRYTTLDKIMVTDVEITLSLAGGGDLRGSIVELVHPGGSANYTLTENAMVLRNIIPGIAYTINIYPSTPYARPGSASFRVREDRSVEIMGVKDLDASTRPSDWPSIAITVQRYACKLRVELSDPYGVIGRFDLYANGVKTASSIGQTTDLDIPCGLYKLHVEPTAENTAYYDKSSVITANLTKNMTVNIPLNRKIYMLRINVVEGANPIHNAKVKITSLETGAVIMTLSTDREGMIQLSLPSGAYGVEVSHDQYSTERIDVVLMRDMTTVVELKPTIVTLILRSMPLILGAIAITVIALISFRIKSRIEARIAKEEYI